jgi:hypothetical protein
MTCIADNAHMCRRMHKIPTSDHWVGSSTRAAYVIQNTTATVHAGYADSSNVQQLGASIPMAMSFFENSSPPPEANR